MGEPTAAAVLKRLRALGKASTLKTYRRHGMGENAFGVSFADFNKLARELKRNQALAEALWDTGNEDARILATFIADPDQMPRKLMEQWIRDSTHGMIYSQTAALAAKTPYAVSLAIALIKKKQEWPSAIGWHMIAYLAMNNKMLEDSCLESLLETIESNIHAAPNRTRDSMNNALISIGLRNDGLAARALAAAKRIGKVEVDHGDTNCKTPDATTYILKARARASRRMRC